MRVRIREYTKDGFEVQKWRWWLPIWIAPIDVDGELNCFSSLETARRKITNDC